MFGFLLDAFYYFFWPKKIMDIAVQAIDHCEGTLAQIKNLFAPFHISFLYAICFNTNVVQ